MKATLTGKRHTPTSKLRMSVGNQRANYLIWWAYATELEGNVRRLEDLAIFWKKEARKLGSNVSYRETRKVSHTRMSD